MKRRLRPTIVAISQKNLFGVFMSIHPALRVRTVNFAVLTAS